MSAALQSALTAGRRLAPRHLGLLFDLLLAGLIVFGVALRFSWTNWSQDTDLHPDEYGLAGTLSQLRLPASLGDYFNTRQSPLSPYQKYDFEGNPSQGGPDNRMRWGQWPITIIRAAGEWTGNTGFGEIRLLGRRLSAFFDTLTLAVTYLIGRRLFGHRVGLLGAALSALAVMQIQQSHFMTADNFAGFFTAAAMYCAVRAAQPASARKAGWLWYGLFGVAFGMALASRINLLPLFGEIVAAALLGFLRRQPAAGDLANGPVAPAAAALAETTAAERPTRPSLYGLIYFALPRLALAGFAGMLAFRLTQPMSFRAARGDTTLLTLRPNPDWVDSMKVAQAESSGIGGGPPGEQWTARPALVFPFVNMVLWGLGLPLGLVAWAGLIWAGWRSARAGEEWQTHLLPLTWAGGYFLFMGTRWVKSIRYFLPIYPFMALYAAWAIVELWRLAQEREAAAARSPGSDGAAATPARPGRAKRPAGKGDWLRIFAAVLAAIVLLGTSAWAWGFTGIYRQANTRVRATRWIYQNIPAPINLRIQMADGQTYVEALPAAPGTQLTADAPLVVPFEPHVDGPAAGLLVGHARNAFDSATAGRVHVALAADGEGQQVLAEGDATMPASPGGDERGGPISAALDSPSLVAGQTYYLRLTAAEGGPIAIAGSTVANESWDEGLPLRLDRRDGFGGLYEGATMEVRWGDDANKRQMFLDTLDRVDYIFVPSQRGLWSTSRLPLTYPLTMAYYKALFEGRLGFDLAAQFQAPIALGPLQISDVAGTAAWGHEPPVPPLSDYPFNNSLFAAEEAFSVYDHAPVWIFRKRANFNLEQARAVLEAVDLSQVVVMGPVPATRAPTLLRLPPDRLAAQRAGGTWSEMFNANGLLNRVQPLGAAAWWLMIVGLGWLAFPLTFAALGGLPDRGYALSKAVALLVVAWFAWLLGSFQLLPFTRATLLLGVLALAGASGFVFWKRQAQIAAHLRAYWRGMAAVEGLMLGLFLFDLLIRFGNPDLWHPYYGGEKPMVFSYFNAVLKSASFPPYNPWLAGHFLNYYYYGFVLMAVPVKLLGIVPNIAYNLILPALFALAGGGAYCVAFNLVARHGADLPEGPGRPRARANPYLAGVAAALLLVALGNLGQWRTLVLGLQAAADGSAVDQSVPVYGKIAGALNGAWRVATGETDIPISLGNWYWDATRIITNINGEGSEITEFPFFTFLYADLHAHMMDLPFTILALGWAAAGLLGAGRAETEEPRATAWARWLVGGLALGVPRLTNTWDFPTYLAIGVLAVAAGALLRGRGLSRAGIVGLGWRVALVVGLALALYYPFDRWFAPAYSELSRWEGTYTPLSGYFYIHGLFLFIVVTFLVYETWRWLAETPATVLQTAAVWLPPWLAAAGLLSVAALLLFRLGIVTGAVSLPLMGWAGLLLTRPDTPASKRAMLFLFGAGLAITLFVEMYALEGDRMNTVFKFYIQVWVLFSVAAGAALAWVWASLAEWNPGWRSGWVGGLTALAAVAALYTFTATGAKIRDRFPSFSAGPGCEPIPGMAMPYADARGLPPADQPHTLDGLLYLTWSAYCDHDRFLPLTYDYEAIRWMQDNVPGSPVIAEAQSFDLYRMSSRYTWNTGLPDVVGWDWHTRQHNAAIPTEFVTERGYEIIDFYDNPDLNGALAFLRKYDVGYVVVGPMERAYYSAEGLAKFDALAARGDLAVVYQNPGVILYQRTER